MRKVIHKFFGIWDYDKEEKWLCEMAAKGLGLVAVGFCRYEFEDCEPGKYCYRLEFLKERPNHPESVKYIEFLESTGIRHVGSYGKWVYLCKETADGDFELFSDRSSQLAHLNRIIRLELLVAGINLFVGVFNLILCLLQNSYANSFGIINLFLAIAVSILSIPLFRTRNKIKKEQNLFES